MNARILIVEDESVIALDIKGRIERFGYEVAAIAVTGEKAVEKVLELNPDLVLMDIMLPGEMDGIQAVEAIRERADVPVVYLTAHTDLATFLRSKSTLPYGYIVKPIRDIELHSAVETAIQRHRLERQLKESEERFRTLAYFASDWEYWIGPYEGFIHISPSCLEVTGYSIAEFRSDSNLLGDIIHPEDRDLMLRHFGEEMKSDSVLSIDFRIISKKGELKWLSHICQPVFSAEGTPIGLRVNNRDITRRKTAEQEKEGAFSELFQIFESSATGMCVIGRDYRYMRANNTFLSMFGLKNAAVLGARCDDILGFPFCRTKDCPLERILKGEKFVEFEIDRRIEGRALHCIVRSVPYVDPSGETVGIIASFIDVTETRELEAAMLDLIQKERWRIGRDLHDGLGQKLTGAAFLAEALRRGLKQKSPRLATEIEEIGGLIGESIEMASAIVRGLCPVAVESHGLVAAIEDLANNTGRLFGVKCDVIRVGELNLTNIEAATHLYYIVQEAVTNAVKHGGGCAIRIELSDENDELYVKIENDSSADRSLEAVPGGLGLRTMRYRAGIIGADFEAGKLGGVFMVTILMRRGEVDSYRTARKKTDRK
ncbi:MAG TPA: PAS domain S-box protein [Spirochaetota bacterium]|nr:PAS domain S-box protein [Spirochaetota bacterium]